MFGIELKADSVVRILIYEVASLFLQKYLTLLIQEQNNGKHKTNAQIHTHPRREDVLYVNSTNIE